MRQADIIVITCIIITINKPFLMDLYVIFRSNCNYVFTFSLNIIYIIYLFNILQGMGGQIGFWGVWLDVNFGKGRCETFCSTFKNYHCPSKFSDFTFEILEAWAVDEVAVSKIVSLFL